MLHVFVYLLMSLSIVYSHFTSRGNHQILSQKDPFQAVGLFLWLGARGGTGAGTRNTTSAQHRFINLWIILLRRAAIRLHYWVRYDPTPNLATGITRSFFPDCQIHPGNNKLYFVLALNVFFLLPVPILNWQGGVKPDLVLRWTRWQSLNFSGKQIINYSQIIFLESCCK